MIFIAFWSATSSPKIGKITGYWTDVNVTGEFTVEYNNNHLYTGSLIEGIRHGYGVLVYPDGSSYNGYWENDKEHGEGSLKFSDQKLFSGLWKDGEYFGVKRDNN